MSMLMSTVFSIGMMVKRNEWTAMKSTGISLYRLSAPLLFVGIMISILSFLLDNQLVSYGNKKRYTIDRDYLEKKSRHEIKSSLKNIFLQTQGQAEVQHNQDQPLQFEYYFFSFLLTIKIKLSMFP